MRLFIAAMPELAGGSANTLMLNILSAFAEFERDIITSRIRDSRAGLVARMAAERGWKTGAGGMWTARQILDTIANPVYLGCFRSPVGTRPGTREAIVDEDLFDRCAAAIAARRIRSAGSRVRREWSHLAGKVRCARCGRVMSTRVTANGTRRYVYFRCRTADADGATCTGTQVRAFDIEETVRSILTDPGQAFPSKRGRPTRAAAALYSLGQLLPLLEPKGERAFIREAVQDVVWNADTRAIRLALNLKALSEELPLVTSVCRLDLAYRP